MDRKDTTFNEIASLLQQNEVAGRYPSDLEEALSRLLLMSRDQKQRDEMIQLHAIRRVTKILKITTSIKSKQFCTAILGNLALSEKGRLSASSCDRWNCVSHRHNCPLFQLLFHAQNGENELLKHLSGAALLSFSMQTECQIQIDNISGIQALLKLIQARDAETNIYAAATLWNMCKSPIIVLKLESIHGILMEDLMRKLTDILWIPLEPFQLSITETGELGMRGLLKSDGQNASLLLAASISSTLTIVLHVENYTGPVRTLRDGFAARATSVEDKKKSKAKDCRQESKSIAHFDESGVLTSRTCAVCSKVCRVKSKSKANAHVVCARESCRQAYHLQCSRWYALSVLDREKDGWKIKLDLGQFYCDSCVLHMPLTYVDFAAHHVQNRFLLSDAQFQTLNIERWCKKCIRPPQEALENEKSIDSIRIRDRSEKDQLSVVFNAQRQLLGIATKQFRIAASSRNEEFYIIRLDFLLQDSYPATHQQVSIRQQKSNEMTMLMAAAEHLAGHVTQWNIAFAEKKNVLFEVGKVLFWPGAFLEDLEMELFAKKSLKELDNAFIYEFIGENDCVRYSLGGNDSSMNKGRDEHQTNGQVLVESSGVGLWSGLFERKTQASKLLAEQKGIKRHELQRRASVVVGRDHLSSALSGTKPRVSRPLQKISNG